MTRYPFGETIKILRQAPRNKFGDAEGGADFHHEIHNVAIHAGDTHDVDQVNRQSNVNSHRNGVREVHHIYMEIGNDVLAGDFVEFEDGEIHRVVGRPKQWKRNPYTGDPGGIQVIVERTSG